MAVELSQMLRRCNWSVIGFSAIATALTFEGKHVDVEENFAEHLRVVRHFRRNQWNLADVKRLYSIKTLSVFILKVLTKQRNETLWQIFAQLNGTIEILYLKSQIFDEFLSSIGQKGNFLPVDIASSLWPQFRQMLLTMPPPCLKGGDKSLSNFCCIAMTAKIHGFRKSWWILQSLPLPRNYVAPVKRDILYIA